MSFLKDHHTNQATNATTFKQNKPVLDEDAAEFSSLDADPVDSSTLVLIDGPVVTTSEGSLLSWTVGKGVPEGVGNGVNGLIVGLDEGDVV